jgi:DNA polymerase I-like protein with 3'-5' exonuclease and polymerase domains
MKQPSSAITSFPPLNLEAVTYEIVKPVYLEAVLKKCLSTQSPNGIDTETTGDNPHCDKIVLLQIAAPNLPVFLIPTDGLTATNIQALRAYFSSSQLKLFQNGKFDVKMLKSLNIDVTSPIFDTMIASRILSCGLDEKHNLGAIAWKYLGIKLDKSLQQSFKAGIPLTHKQCLYGAIDPLILLYLYPILQQQLNQFSKANAIAQGVGIYGWGELRLQRYAYQEWGQLLTKVQAKQAIQQFRRVYPGITRYHQYIKDYTVKTHTSLWGRYRSMKRTSPNDRSAYLIQGSASDLIKQCMLLAHNHHPSPQMQVVLVLKQCIGIEVSPSCATHDVLDALSLEWSKCLQQSIKLVPVRVVAS